MRISDWSSDVGSSDLDVTVAELRAIYDAVVLATGAPSNRALDIPGADLHGVIGYAAFVGWYNGHPHFADLAPALHGPGAVVLGNGNVALDVSRFLATTEAALHRSGARQGRTEVVLAG